MRIRVLSTGVILALIICSSFLQASGSGTTSMKIVGTQHPRFSTDNSYDLVFSEPLVTDSTIQLALVDDGGKTMITLTPIQALRNSHDAVFNLYFTPGVGIDSGKTYHIIAIIGNSHALYSIIPVSSDKELANVSQSILKLHSVTESLVPNKWNVNLLFCAGDDSMDSTWITISSDVSKKAYYVTPGLGPHSCSIVDYVIEAKIPVSIKASFGSTESHIPQWIKSNAKWWSKGQIQDSEFVEGMRYLISQGTIVVPVIPHAPDSLPNIPTWIKNNAGSWADGWISDDEFLKGIEYLISNGIMKI